jgi:[ribosomal protein S18]-alanine N-acetyltransferase
MTEYHVEFTGRDNSLACGPMSPSDLDDVLAIENVSFARPWSGQMFLDEMSNQAASVIVFKTSGRVVGYLCFWEVVDEGHLLNIAVHPDRRSDGLGTFMMDHLVHTCRQRRLSRILLDVGRRNVPARNLYKKFGFASIGFRKNYYAEIQDDALVMEKLLVSSESEDVHAETPQPS